ncbi:MAG: hypothetical protein Q4A90_09990 [Streptococcus sp.]|nr:hypothetical protein [Streptococcus sp.]
MIDFASYHYFKTSFVIESVYSKEFHDRLFQILNKNYHLIYIDTSEKERKLRSLDSDGDFIKKELKKKKLGIPSLKEVADVIIDNSGTVSFSETQLNNYFQNQ